MSVEFERGLISSVRRATLRVSLLSQLSV